ncbi:MAG: hypothetical protein LBT33_05825 [Spirochaetia bacterium]|nr:hypothetical protein [Spirochaetia bacterium]
MKLIEKILGAFLALGAKNPGRMGEQQSCLQDCDQPGFPLQVLGFAAANPVGFPLQSLARKKKTNHRPHGQTQADASFYSPHS